jgi:hypothetical protein
MVRIAMCTLATVHQKSELPGFSVVRIALRTSTPVLQNSQEIYTHSTSEPGQSKILLWSQPKYRKYYTAGG